MPQTHTIACKTILGLLLLLNYTLLCQPIDSLNHEAMPKEGITQLALEYFKIDFTRQQRQTLEGIALELIYSIDEKGNPTLEKVNGVNDPSIVDSLIRRTSTLTGFFPKVTDGIPESSLYFLKIKFPEYNEIIQENHFSRNRGNNIADFESIETGRMIDLLFGGVGNAFSGSAQEYLKPGGGMKLDILFLGKNKFGIGMVMNVYANGLKKEYPINAPRPQETVPPTLLIGLALNQALKEMERKEIGLTLEFNVALHNIVSSSTANSQDYIQFVGFSPGLVGHILLKLGKEKLSSYYLSPVINQKYLNLHAAVRPLFYDVRQASGVMVEVGISFRLRLQFIEAYKLKY